MAVIGAFNDGRGIVKYMTVTKNISLGIIDSNEECGLGNHYCMKVQMTEGDEWRVSDGYCKIEGTKICERDCFMVRLPDEMVKEIFGEEEEGAEDES